MSNKEKEIVEKICSAYKECEISKLDELRRLDRSTRRPAEVLAYIIGTLGSLILGAGMCLCMPDVIDGYMMIGVPVGILGIIMVSVNYLIYRSHLGARRRRASEEIFRLSGEILGNN